MLEDYSRARICVQTFVREEDLPPGQQLLTCSKCGITCYLNREAQRKNWKYHKKVCCLLVEDDKRIQKPIPTFAEAKALFSELLENPQEKIKGRLFLHVFQELTRHLNENDRYAFLKGDAFDKVFNRDLMGDLLGNDTEHLSATVEPGTQNIIDTYSDFAAMVDGMSNEQFVEAMREMGLSCSPQELFKAMKKQGRMG